MKKQLPGWAVLLIITLVAGIALGGTYALTKDPIAEQSRLREEAARKTALPSADTFEAIQVDDEAEVDWAFAGLKDGQTVGYVAQKTVQGFGGEVEVIAGLDTDLTLTGISVGGANFSETAGLGARSREEAFTSQFAGKKTPVAVIKAGGAPGDNTVDALTSATITSNAVRDAVNGVAKYVKSDLLGIADAEMPARPDDSLVFSAKERGFASPVYVEAAFDKDGKITYISVGDEEFNETAGYGAAALETENQYPFIGAQMPLEIGDVDALSGATFTKTAIVNGLNKAYDASRGVEAVEPEPEVISLPEKPAEGVFSASEKGFEGPVYVEAAFDKDGKVSYISVGDDQFNETAGFGARALEPAEQIKFIGAQMPLEIGDVDALSGATFTKTAIVNGLNKAYAASQPQEEEATPEPVPEETPEVKAQPEETPAPQAVPTVVPGLAEPEKDGAFSGESVMFFTAYRAEASFDEDALTALRLYEKPVGQDEYVPSPLDSAYQEKLIGLKLPLTADTEKPEGVAEYTHEAVILAVNQAFAAYSPAAAFPTPGEAVYATGECLIFFDKVLANAGFSGDILSSVSVRIIPVGEISAEGEWSEEPWSALVGQTMPLPLSDNAVAGEPAYLVQAVVIALNQAYDISIADQP